MGMPRVCVRVWTCACVADADQLRGDQQADRVAHEEDDGGATDEQGGGGGGGRRGGGRRAAGGARRVPLPHGEEGVRHGVEQALLLVRERLAHAAPAALLADQPQGHGAGGERVPVRRAARGRQRAALLLGRAARRPRPRRAHAAGAVRARPRRLAARHLAPERRAVGGGRRAARRGGRGGGRAGRRGLRLRAPPHRRAGGARPGGAGAVPRGGRGVQGGAAGGVRGGRAAAGGAARPAGVGEQDADVGAEGLPARAARAARHAPPAPEVPRRRQAGEPVGARVGGGGAGRAAAGAQPVHAAAGAGAPAARGGARRAEPHDARQPGRVRGAHAAARAPRVRRRHPRPQVLQRARRDAARPLRPDLRAARAERTRGVPVPRARAAPLRAANARRLQRGRRSAGEPVAAGRGRGGGRALLAAPPAAAAAARARRAPRAPRAPRTARAQRRGPVQQQLGGVGVVVQRVPPARRGRPPPARGPAAPARGPAPPARRRAARRARAAARAPLHAPLQTRAHAVRVSGRERGRAVVRAQPDHHQRGAQRRAGLAARHAQREERARARELRRAAAVSGRRDLPYPAYLLC